MSKHYSPLRYPGGKARLADFLSKLLKSKADGQDIVFVEPFAGGAGAALQLLIEGNVSKILINDLDPAIYAFWKIAVYDTDRLIRKIQRTDVSIKEWKKQRVIYKKKPKDDLKFAFATFYMNRTNRSGIIEGGPIGGFGQKGEWKLDARFNKKGLIERLRKIKEFRNQITVKNLDGIELLKEIQGHKDFKDHFIFIDPPYVEKGKLLYLNHYQQENHKKLAKFLNSSLLDWVMTYDDTPFIRELYSEKVVKRFDIAHTAHARKIGKEVFISPLPIRNRIKLVG
ncbi:MAG: DNA adenine methylase [Candidatus Paceibacterota bacterium]